MQTQLVANAVRKSAPWCRDLGQQLVGKKAQYRRLTPPATIRTARYRPL